MPKKTRKKTATTKSKTKSAKAPKRPAKTASKTPSKTSKPVLLKKSSSKAAVRPKAPAAKKTAARGTAVTAAKAAPRAKTVPAPSKPEGAAKVIAKVPSKTPAKSTASRIPQVTRQVTRPDGPLSEGHMALSFDLPRDGGERVSLQDFAGEKLVLFFYPRADTPGCTREAIDFSRLKPAFEAAGTRVVGVSADPVKAQDSFRNKHELQTPLASDEEKEMLKDYGVWGEKSMYGRTFLGVLRTTVLIGEDGRVLRIWRNVKVDGHADEVLEAVRAL